jgi:hypothetical protein
MADTLLVSVLMPVYNGEEYLGEAIESILNQTFRDFEFIIINDGSIDGTAEILAECAERDKRIQVHQQANQGLTATLNKGLNLARGQYIARMDADDISLPERLATQVDFLNRHSEVGLVSANCYFIDSAGKITHGPFLLCSLAGAQVEWELYWGNPIVHPSIMVRTTVIRSCGGYPVGHSYYTDDYALWLQMIKVTRMVVLQRPLLYLRKHGQNVTAVKLESHLSATIDVARSALAERVGYRPSACSLRLARNMYVAHPVSSLELKQTSDLLLDAFQELTTRYQLDDSQEASLKHDLAWRLMQLAPHGPWWGDALQVFSRSVRLSPRAGLSRAGIIVLVKVLLGQRLTDVARRFKQAARIA